MANYADLADQLSARNVRDAMSYELLTVQDSSALQIYENVKVQVRHESEKANTELQKRGRGRIERVFLPSYQGRLCLTFGSQLLCTVDLQEAKGQIAAIITGPPNALEISRKEFALTQYRPEQIAVEIVSGLLQGEFA